MCNCLCRHWLSQATLYPLHGSKGPRGLHGRRRGAGRVLTSRSLRLISHRGLGVNRCGGVEIIIPHVVHIIALLSTVLVWQSLLRRPAAAAYGFKSPVFSESTESVFLAFLACCASHCLYAEYQKQPANPMIMPTIEVGVGSPSKKIWNVEASQGGVEVKAGRCAAGSDEYARHAWHALSPDSMLSAPLLAGSPWR